MIAAIVQPRDDPGQHADRPVLTTRRDRCPDVSFQMLPEVNQPTSSFHLGAADRGTGRSAAS